MAIKMQQTILLATDLSPRGDRAFDRSRALAQAWKMPLTLVHVLPETSPYSQMDPEHQRMQIASEFPPLDEDIHIVVRQGPIVENILSVTKEKDAILIVTAVARHNSLGDVLLGTPVDYLVRQAPCPVLIVKRRPFHDYKKILIATDFSECSRAAFHTASAFFPTATFHIVHAYHVPYEAWLTSQQVRDDVTAEAEAKAAVFMKTLALSGDLQKRVKVEVEYGELGTVIAQHIRQTAADLVALGTHGHSGLFHGTIGSNAESLLSWLPCDTLVVRR